MGVFGKDGAAIEWRRRHETVLIEPWGAGSFRVRGPLWQETRDDLPGGAAALAALPRRRARPQSGGVRPGRLAVGMPCIREGRHERA